jgi:hypothetical protein
MRLYPAGPRTGKGLVRNSTAPDFMAFTVIRAGSAYRRPFLTACVKETQGVPFSYHTCWDLNVKKMEEYIPMNKPLCGLVQSGVLFRSFVVPRRFAQVEREK